MIPTGRGAIRLVATDLDGTLLRGDGTISERTRRVLARLEEAGIGLVFVTARPPRWMGPIAAMTGHRGLAVCANGAIVYDLRLERIVECTPLSIESIQAIVPRLRRAIPGGAFAVETVEGFACEPGHLQHQWDEGVEPRTGDVLDLLDRPVAKLLFGHPGRPADELLDVVRAAIGDLAEVTHSNPERAAVELAAPGVSKASAVAGLCARKGVERGEVIAFGDMPNDLPLLTWAGTAVAVANAHRDVLAAVPNRTFANDDDGVARVLERLLSSGCVGGGASPS